MTLKNLLNVRPTSSLHQLHFRLDLVSCVMSGDSGLDPGVAGVEGADQGVAGW